MVQSEHKRPQKAHSSCGDNESSFINTIEPVVQICRPDSPWKHNGRHRTHHDICVAQGTLYCLIPALDKPGNFASSLAGLPTWHSEEAVHSVYIAPLRQLAPQQEDIVLWSPYHGSEKYVLRNYARACRHNQLDDNLTTRRNAKGSLHSFW
jgi:hypothetical protein